MKWLKRILKIFVITALIFGFLLFVLAMLGGNNDTLKGALEDFISKSTNTKVSVQTLNRIEFYPDLAFDFEGLQGLAGKDGDIEVFSVGSVHLAMSFWDMTFSTGKLKDIDIRNVYMAPGLWGKQIVSLEHIGIEASADSQQAALKAQGLVGDKVFGFEAPMTQTGEAEDIRYKFSDQKYVDFTLGDAKARLAFHEDGTVLEPQKRGEDYCHLVSLLLDLDIVFAHNCPVAEPVPEMVEEKEAVPEPEVAAPETSVPQTHDTVDGNPEQSAP